MSFWVDRSLYPENVEVRSTDLRFEAEQKAYHILQRTRDFCTLGTANGLSVVVNTTDPTTIDITVGRAYTPNGDIVSLETSATQVALADETSNVMNYVGLEYSESETFPGPDELTGEPRNRRVVRNATLRVLTSTAYDALSEATQDNIAVIAVVRGAGGSDLTEDDIVQSGAIEAQLGLSNLVPGIECLSVSQTHAGLDVSGATFTRGHYVLEVAGLQLLSGELAYRYNAADSYGTPVAVSFTDTNQIVTLAAAADTTRTITLRVNGPLLRHNITTQSGAIDGLLRIHLLYQRTAGKAGGRDQEHRESFGVAPTAADPHGVDLSDRALRTPAVITADSTSLAPRRYDRVTVSTAGGTLSYKLIEEVQGDGTPGYREYIGGSLLFLDRLRVYNAYIDDTGTWVKDNATQRAWREIVRIGQTTGSLSTRREVTGLGDVTWTPQFDETVGVFANTTTLGSATREAQLNVVGPISGTRGANIVSEDDGFGNTATLDMLTGSIIRIDGDVDISNTSATTNTIGLAPFTGVSAPAYTISDSTRRRRRVLTGVSYDSSTLTTRQFEFVLGFNNPLPYSIIQGQGRVLWDVKKWLQAGHRITYVELVGSTPLVGTIEIISYSAAGVRTVLGTGTGPSLSGSFLTGGATSVTDALYLMYTHTGADAELRQLYIDFAPTIGS